MEQVLANLQAIGAPSTQFNLDVVWTLITAFLVFFMQAGFAMVEAGFIQAKHVGNVLMKNLLDFAMGAIAFWVVGFGLMFGHGNGFIGKDSFMPNPNTDPAVAHSRCSTNKDLQMPG
jgi:Amt family ammonium transporter